MKKLGIYFGLNSVSLIEVDGKKVLAASQIPLDTSEETSGFFDPTKLIASLEEQIARLNITSKNAVIALSSKDLIIRSFDLPLLPRNELSQAVNSEVVKYIPFKIEDLTFDFQIKTSRKEKKDYVLFVAAKNEDLERNISVLESLSLKVADIDYSVFAMLRLLKLSDIDTKGVVAFIDIDLTEESNICILEDSFPYFCRNLKLSFDEAEDKADISSMLEKLRSEIRISLDYYRRKFPAKELKKAAFIVKDELRYEIEAICKDLDLTPYFVKIPLGLLPQAESDFGILKAYAAAMEIKMPFDINILSGKGREFAMAVSRDASALEQAIQPQPPLKIQPGIIAVGLLIAVATYLFVGINKILPLRQEIKQIISQRQHLFSITTEQSTTSLKKMESDYNKKLKILEETFKKRLYITPELNFIPQLLTDGMWLTNITYEEGLTGLKLVIKGFVYLDDQQKEVDSVQNFLSQLKANEVFGSLFSEINLSSYRRDSYKDIELTYFDIVCTKRN